MCTAAGTLAASQPAPHGSLIGTGCSQEGLAMEWGAGRPARPQTGLQHLFGYQLCVCLQGSGQCVLRREEAFPWLHLSPYILLDSSVWGAKVHHMVLAINHWGCPPQPQSWKLLPVGGAGNWGEQGRGEAASTPLTMAGTRKDRHPMAQQGSPNTFPLSQGPEPQAILVASFQSRGTRPQASWGVAATLSTGLCPRRLPLMLWMAP